MTASRTYLDHNATSPLRPEARAAMAAVLDVCGNPSSVHAEGRRARALIEASREEVAALVNARPHEIVFTSGATEANAWVLGAGGWNVVLASGIEHDSIRGPLAGLSARQVALAAAATGEVDINAIARHVLIDAAAGERVLVVLQMANNETGVLQPVGGAASLARGYGLCVHTDAVQAAGKITVDFAGLGVDTMSLSAHKLGGPAGVGALVIRDGMRLASFVTGGGQERRRRAGTENLLGIVGFGAAAAAARRTLGQMSQVRALRDALERGIAEVTPAAMVIGAAADRLPNTCCVALPGAASETQVIKLDLAGIAVSAGAACSSGKVGASHVLAAMGLAPDMAASSIRVSLGWNSTEADVAAFLEAWRAIARRPAERAVA